MSALPYIARYAMPVALALLEESARDLNHRAAGKFDRPAARALMLATGLQESRFEHRRQIRGPALSFFQAESGGGFAGLVTHPQTSALARDLLQRMGYGEPDRADFYAIEHNDIMACCGARLLLWTHPDPLPGPADPQAGWAYYTATWRPGKPHRQTWDAFWAQAWAELQRL